MQPGNCFGLAAQLSYYFFLALFPAPLFLVALASFFPIANLMDEITAALFYGSSLAILVGAEMNAEIEHASPCGKPPGKGCPAKRTCSVRLPSARGTTAAPPDC